MHAPSLSTAGAPSVVGASALKQRFPTSRWQSLRILLREATGVALPRADCQSIVVLVIAMVSERTLLDAQRPVKRPRKLLLAKCEPHEGANVCLGRRSVSGVVADAEQD